MYLLDILDLKILDDEIVPHKKNFLCLFSMYKNVYKENVRLPVHKIVWPYCVESYIAKILLKCRVIWTTIREVIAKDKNISNEICNRHKRYQRNMQLFDYTQLKTNNKCENSFNE